MAPLLWDQALEAHFHFRTAHFDGRLRQEWLDLLHISRLEPLETIPPKGSNGQG
jgi:hypothetical protein